jgi:hypothetical protein
LGHLLIYGELSASAHHARETDHKPLPKEIATNFVFGTEDHHLLKRHPLFYGLQLYRVRAKYHDTRVKFANAAGAVVSCAHLYHALKRENLLTNLWPDMELFLKLHDGGRLFAGCVPHDPKVYLFQY